MGSKMGRPKSDNPKSNDVKVRLDEETHKDLMNYCEKNKFTKAEAIRKAIYLLLKSFRNK